MSDGKFAVFQYHTPFLIEQDKQKMSSSMNFTVNSLCQCHKQFARTQYFSQGYR